MSRARTGSEADRLNACGVLLYAIADKANVLGQLSVMCLEAVEGMSTRGAALASACREFAAVVGALSDEGLMLVDGVQYRGDALQWIGTPEVIVCLEAAAGVNPGGRPLGATGAELAVDAGAMPPIYPGEGGAA